MLSLSTQQPHPPVRFPQLQLPRLELLFKDGTTVWLHQPTADPLTRSFDHQGESITVDLRTLDRDMNNDVYSHSASDTPAIIFFRLRQKYSTADHFIAAARGRDQ